MPSWPLAIDRHLCLNSISQPSIGERISPECDMQDLADLWWRRTSSVQLTSHASLDCEGSKKRPKLDRRRPFVKLHYVIYGLLAFWLVLCSSMHKSSVLIGVCSRGLRRKWLCVFTDQWLHLPPYNLALRLHVFCPCRRLWIDSASTIVVTMRPWHLPEVGGSSTTVLSCGPTLSDCTLITQITF